MTRRFCALSYLVQHSGKPIVLTGAQKSIYVQDTDARRNLYDAFVAAQDDCLAGVYIVFDGRVILGTRARKTRTKSMNAFSSIDYPDVALIRDGRILHYILQGKPTMPPVFHDKLDANVFVLRLIPGMNPDVLRPLANRFDALVIESFGVGRAAYEELYRKNKHLRNMLRGVSAEGLNLEVNS